MYVHHMYVVSHVTKLHTYIPYIHEIPRCIKTIYTEYLKEIGHAIKTFSVISPNLTGIVT